MGNEAPRVVGSLTYVRRIRKILRDEKVHDNGFPKIGI